MRDQVDETSRQHMKKIKSREVHVYFYKMQIEYGPRLGL